MKHRSKLSGFTAFSLARSRQLMGWTEPAVTCAALKKDRQPCGRQLDGEARRAAYRDGFRYCTRHRIATSKDRLADRMAEAAGAGFLARLRARTIGAAR